MTQIRILHLVDDMTAGGVMRALDYLKSRPQLLDHGDHQVVHVGRRALSHGMFKADIIVSHLSIGWRMLPALLALRASHPGVRLVHIEHSYTRAFTALNVTHKRRFFGLLRVAYSVFDQIVAVSRDQADWMLERDLVDAEALVVIPSRVDLTAFAGIAPAPDRVRVIGAIGRLDRQKGFDVLIDAFRMCDLPEARLHIYGEGPEREMLMARARGDARIRFFGHISDPLVAYGRVDAVAMPSRWEAYGLVALEARAAGRPLLVSDVDGLKGHAALGGHLVRGYSARDWADQITRLCSETHRSQPITEVEVMAAEAQYAERWVAVFEGKEDIWQRKSVFDFVKT